MKASLRTWMALVLALATAGLPAAERRLIVSFIPPAAATAPGQTIDVQVAVLNPTGDGATIAWPETIAATLGGGDSRLGSAIAMRRREDAASAGPTIAPGAFALQTYAVDIPRSQGTGDVTVEASLPGVGAMRGTIDLRVAATAADSHASTTQRPTTNLARARTAAAALRRTFADRLGAHEPIYFSYGGDAPNAKFQFSFKYRLLDFRDLAPQRVVRSLQFGFTQRSLWDIDGVSSPFYDTSYMPELIYEALAPDPGQSARWFTWLGFQAAFKHESNGRDGPMSRSLNVVYARPVFAFGNLQGWHLLAIPEVFTYVDTLEDNPDLKDYRGYGKLHLVLGRNDGPSLMATLWSGKNLDHATVQLDLTLPLRTRLLNFETYLLVQYFNGYGESLRSYNQTSETVRAGFSLVR